MPKKIVTTSTAEIKQKISEFAKSLGFDLVGFSKAKIEKRYLSAFKKWLNREMEADMAYMREIKRRSDLTQILPGAKSVIVLATNYYYKQPPLRRGHARVARYAYGRDYHKVIGARLKKLEKFIQTLVPELQKITGSTSASPSKSVIIPPAQITKSYVDTGPVLERALAEQAGLGRIGKNACLITPEFGSWVFLSEIIITLDLSAPSTEAISVPTTPANPAAKSATFTSSKLVPTTLKTRWQSGTPANVCGNCTRCIDACPTGAIIAPGVIDSRLCISYLTIENRDQIPPELAAKIREVKTLFGCDICQAVCPHNQARQKQKNIVATASPLDSLHSHAIAGDQLSLKQISKLKTPNDYLAKFAGSSLMRAKLSGLQRNARVLE